MFLLRRCKGCKHLFVGVVLGISTTAVFMSLKASNESVQPVTLGRLHRSDYKPHANNVLPSRFTHPRMDGRFMEADHPEEGEEGVAKGGRFNFDDPEAHGGESG
ncbi:hypothetical protein BaRGS_00011658 [Batillaria attramentaria]|uniref:Uncharacterized protein n=1 Tax=Batillaria attramentaria TaxID=370345 RepID=A0ABD0LCT3_9CAEN